MPLVHHQATIAASVDEIWDHLLRKVERPEDYVPAAISSEILARPGPDTVERLMVLRDETGEDRPTQEIITADQPTLTIIFKAKNNPVFDGVVINTVMDEGEHPIFAITMSWTEKPGVPNQDAIDWTAMVRDAVEQTKRQVEAEIEG